MKPFIITIAGLVFCVSAAGQSLWNPDRPMPSLFTDTIARNVGDILTVVIDENQIVKNNEISKLEKESSLDAVLENFDILPNLFEPLPAAKGSSTRKFDGKGTYDKDNSFRTTMSVVVIDRLPNGNLLIEGTRSIIMDGETKSIRLTGLVRSLDVTSGNTVLSSQIANASIAYEGEGFLNQATNRGWFSRLLDIVWPF
ncbi:MAG TPA: flagellar basal body L-ring protein FlgH [Planctomycetes bacterium]|nr:flagellar basal body L-ring protein FlgH [Planctomycetota bacterium]